MPCPAMSENIGATKRPMSDTETEATPSNSKRLRVSQSPETSSRRDAKRRKKKRKKAPVVPKLEGVHHRQNSSSQQRPLVSAPNKIIRFTSAELSASKSSAQVLSHSTAVILNSVSHEGDAEKDSRGESQTDNLVCLVPRCLFYFLMTMSRRKERRCLKVSNFVTWNCLKTSVHNTL